MTANGLHSAAGPVKTPPPLGAASTAGPSAQSNPATALANQALSLGTTPASSLKIHANDLAPLLEETEEQAIKNRDGYLWECIGRKEVLDGGRQIGFTYKFRLRDEFDLNRGKKEEVRENLRSMSNQLFPAIESGWEMITDVAFCDTGKKLGYDAETTTEGRYITLPDKEVLEHRWKSVMGNNELRIVSSKEIASDRDFIDAFGRYDVLLSTGREFVHDHLVHAIPTFTFMVRDYQGYMKQREETAEVINKMVANVAVVRKWVDDCAKELPKDLDNRQGKEFFRRLQRNMPYADVIPAIYADQLAAQTESADANRLSMLVDFRKLTFELGLYDDFLERRVSKELSDNYEKDNGSEIAPTLLNKFVKESMKDISLGWLSEQISAILDLVSKNNKQ